MSTDNQDTPLSVDSGPYDRAAMNRDAVRQFGENAKVHSLATPEAAQKHADAWSGVLRRYDFTSTEASNLATLDGMALGKPPTAETRAEWAADAKAALLATYGPDRVGEALDLAKKFVAQDPELRRLAAKGYGDHRNLVLLAARQGLEAKKSGRLK